MKAKSTVIPIIGYVHINYRIFIVYYPFNDIAHKTFSGSVILDGEYVVWYNFESAINVYAFLNYGIVRLYRSMNIAYNMQAIQNLNRKTLDGKLT
jgi:hypothetical protein